MKQIQDGDKLSHGLGSPIRKEKSQSPDVQISKNVFRDKKGKFYTADPKNEEANAKIGAKP